MSDIIKIYFDESCHLPAHFMWTGNIPGKIFVVRAGIISQLKR